MESGIEFKNVSFAYGSKPVFNDFSLTIEKDKLTCLLGSTGCGKTTLLRLIAGLEKPENGEILIENKIVSSPKIFMQPARRQVGMVFQNLALWPHFTVYKNIAWGLKVNKINDTGKRVEDMLNLFNLNALSERYPHQISGGQKQLVAIARSLALQPKILLMDEPLSNLDSKLKSSVISHIINLKKMLDITIVYVTHDNRDAEQLADETVWLTSGI